MMAHRHCFKFAAGFLSVFAAPLSASEPFFMGLGDLDGGIFLSTARGVSSDGAVIVGYGYSNAGQEAFRWTAETGIYGLGDLTGGSFVSTANAVSSDGTVVVGDSSATNGYFAFKWVIKGDGPDGTMTVVGDLPGGDRFSIGAAVSADGNVVAGHSSSTASGTLGADAYRKVGNEPITSLGDLPGGTYFSVSTGLSDDGTVVAGYSSSTASGAAGSEATIWTEADGLVGLGDLAGGGYGSNAFGISADGYAIVGVAVDESGVVAFRWTDPKLGGLGMESLGDLPGNLVSGRANGVNGDGSVVVGQGYTDLGFEAFLWDEINAMRNLKEVMESVHGLDLSEWKLEIANAISADGSTVVGYGINPEGEYEAFVAHLGRDEICDGDVNGDGAVDPLDSGFVQSRFDCLVDTGDVDCDSADANSDGSVDPLDVGYVLSRFGNCD